MPSPQIYILEDCTEDIKRAVIEKVTQAMVEAVGAPKENARAWIHDFAEGKLWVSQAHRRRPPACYSRPAHLRNTSMAPQQDVTNSFNKEEGVIHIGGID